MFMCVLMHRLLAWPRVLSRRAGVELETDHFQQVPRGCCCLQPRNYLLKRKGQTAEAEKQEELGGFKDLERSLESKEQGTGHIA